MFKSVHSGRKSDFKLRSAIIRIEKSITRPGFEPVKILSQPLLYEIDHTVLPYDKVVGLFSMVTHLTLSSTRYRGKWPSKTGLPCYMVLCKIKNPSSSHIRDRRIRVSEVISEVRVFSCVPLWRACVRVRGFKFTLVRVRTPVRRKGETLYGPDIYGVLESIW